MAQWGFRTWDANGVDNNTGIVRVLVVGSLAMTSGQQSASATFTVPSGITLDYLFQSTQGEYVYKRRKVVVSGGAVTISSVADGDYSTGTASAAAGYYLFYLRK